MNQRIYKNYREEPSSFEDLTKRFLKKHEDELACCKVITVPVYIVNKLSGFMQEINNATIFLEKYCGAGTFCSIHIKKRFTTVASFYVNHDDRYKDKLVDIVWGSFYSRNYELFLHQKDAAEYSKKLILPKIERLNKEINMLNSLCAG